MIYHRINTETMKTQCGKKLTNVTYTPLWTITTCPLCLKQTHTTIKQKIESAKSLIKTYEFKEDIYNKGSKQWNPQDNKQ